MKPKLCPSCNSPLVKVKKGRNVSVECSYCGKSYEKGTEVETFIPEYDGDDE
jgi:DNA-directed RNA polymerase subunit M/transcription elongation factor TFIIS